jgi:hypothetical protein
MGAVPCGCNSMSTRNKVYAYFAKGVRSIGCILGMLSRNDLKSWESIVQLWISSKYFFKLMKFNIQKIEFKGHIVLQQLRNPLFWFRFEVWQRTGNFDVS